MGLWLGGGAAPAIAARAPAVSSQTFPPWQVLSDTRFGEYQLGMAVRYSRMVFRDGGAKQEAEQTALTTAFGERRAPPRAAPPAAPSPQPEPRRPAEQRIAKSMNDAGVSYFGRLVMSSEGGDGWLSATRYGSVDDAHRGTAAVKEMFAPELSKWFSSYDSIVGRAVRVLEM